MKLCSKILAVKILCRNALMALLCGLAFSTSAFSALEQNLPTTFPQEILPYFQAAKKGTFAGKGGIPIAWRVLPASGSGPVKAIVILNGRTEFMMKYAEFAYDLRDSGYSLYFMDHRGQGESGRLLPDEPFKGHVEKFHDYIDDVGTFIDQVVQKDSPSEIHIVAHSMGGAIATIYAIENPKMLNSLTLLSPMFEANLGSYTEDLALVIAFFYKLFGMSTDLAPGRRIDEWKDPFQGNTNNHSENRYDYGLNLALGQPSLAVGGPTVRWVQESIRAMRFIRDHGANILTPMRIVEATEDQTVIPAAEESVCQKAPACSLIKIPGAFHGLPFESDSYRNPSLDSMMEWIRSHGK